MSPLTPEEMERLSHVVWGTDAIWTGSPQWQIEGLRRLEIPEEMRAKYDFEPLGPADGPLTRGDPGREQCKALCVSPQNRAELQGDKIANWKTLYESTEPSAPTSPTDTS